MASEPCCKCCGRIVAVFARIDAARSCLDGAEPVLPPSGIEVTYWRCSACGFIFTTDFDTLSSAELGERIYNADYARVDPDFAFARPASFAELLQDLLAPHASWIEALDFGGGEGKLSRMMREHGFPCFDSYDPFFSEGGLPQRRYDLVTAFEVVEHSRDPLETVQQMRALMKPGGAILFSTLLQPRRVRPDWWYIGPRNGHVSIYTDRSLQALARRIGVLCLSVSDGLHLLYADREGRTARLLVQRLARKALRNASLRGSAALVSTAFQVARCGQPREAMDPRHVVRLLMRPVMIRRPARALKEDGGAPRELPVRR